MPHQNRQRLVRSSRTVVVKIGSNVLTADDGTFDRRRVSALARQICAATDAGRRIVVVSSGAISAGLGEMGFPTRPRDLPHLQAAAAVGQSQLMRAYVDSFRRHGRHAAQILLTRSDLEDRTRYLNARNTIQTLFEWNTIPIINENDTVSIDEIRFGDNDLLAAMVTNLLRAPLLVLLTVVDGLCHQDPHDHTDAKVLEMVDVVTEQVTASISARTSPLGQGGMRSKLEAARVVCQAGEAVVIANGKRAAVLGDILDGKPVGTLCLPHPVKMSSRRRWIGLTARPCGRLAIDDGAYRALVRNGRSLLAIGVRRVEGRFRKGDVVSICRLSGEEIARGLTNYKSEDVARIAGLRTSQLAKVLGDRPYDEVVHRDNLTVLCVPS